MRAVEIKLTTCDDSVTPFDYKFFVALSQTNSPKSSYSSRENGSISITFLFHFVIFPFLLSSNAFATGFVFL